MLYDFDGGNQDLPTASDGGLSQNRLNSFTDLLDSFTVWFFFQPSLLCRSLYSDTKWYLPTGIARQVAEQ